MAVGQITERGWTGYEDDEMILVSISGKVRWMERPVTELVGKTSLEKVQKYRVQEFHLGHTEFEMP